MIIWSAINFPTIICSPTVCYFSREKPLVKPTTPESLSHIICLCDLLLFAFIFRSIKPKTQKYSILIYYICIHGLFLFAFIFRSINPKIQKYFAEIFIYLFYLAFALDLFIQSTTILPIFLPVRDWQPLSYVGLQVFVHCV